ncbi:MAG TPA: FHA domain-containing protein [Planctomycetaceae bacterium]|nr:FHA domain-containing protein [Planctomycetaceae bacterium]
MTFPVTSGAPGSTDFAASAASPRLFLTICRGQTRFPRRPVGDGVFLIGSAPECQLRLGGTVPPQHSALRPDGAETLIEAVAEFPPLRVNGVECRQSAVRSGDLIEIGPFALGVEAPLPVERSAAELVSLIEAEQAMVDEFESGRLRGGEALLNAVRRRATELTRTSGEPATEFLEDLESAVDLLHDFSNEMERRAGRLSEREAGFARAARRLLDAQQRLGEQITAVQKRIHLLDAEQPAPRRKVA